MAENRKSKDQRFYFTRNQLLLLGGAFVAAAVVIFFLGVFTGKGIEERRLVKIEEPPVKIPVKPAPSGAASGQGGARNEELTFYNTLTKPAGTKAPAEEKPKETKATQKSAKAEVKESKAQSKEKPEPALIPAGESAPAPKAVEKKAEKVPPPAPKPVDKKAEKPSPAPATEKAAQSGEKVERGGKGWTVQVNAFPEEKSAKSWVDRLKNKGYNAYVTEVNIKGKTWYRVRVGNYSTREEAKKVEETLKTKENYPKAFTATR